MHTVQPFGPFGPFGGEGLRTRIKYNHVTAVRSLDFLGFWFRHKKQVER